jgi:iron complex transport system substrate-binding protein
VATIVGETAKGEALVRQTEAAFSAVAEERRLLQRKARVLFVLSVQNGRLTVGGKNTAADTMLDLAGATNVAAALDGFKPISEEALHQMAPEAIVVMTRSRSQSVRDALAVIPAVIAMDAWKQGRVIEMDGLFLMGFGPRAPEAARQLMRSLYAPAKATRLVQ